MTTQAQDIIEATEAPGCVPSVEMYLGFDPGFLREKLLEALREVRCTGGRGDGTPYRWDAGELAEVVAPVLARLLAKRV